MSYWEAYIELPEKLTLECGHKQRVTTKTGVELDHNITVYQFNV